MPVHRRGAEQRPPSPSSDARHRQRPARRWTVVLGPLSTPGSRPAGFADNRLHQVSSHQERQGACAAFTFITQGRPSSRQRRGSPRPSAEQPSRRHPPTRWARAPTGDERWSSPNSASKVGKSVTCPSAQRCKRLPDSNALALSMNVRGCSFRANDEGAGSGRPGERPSPREVRKVPPQSRSPAR